MVVRDFRRKKWSPEGSRPHVFIRAGTNLINTDLYTFCENTDRYLHIWEPGCHEFLRSVNPYFRHLTLAWLGIPTASTPAGSWQALTEELRATVPPALPITLTAQQAVVSVHGVQVWVERTPELERLAEQTRHAMRTVYGPDAPISHPGPDWHPHIQIAYGI